MKPKLDKKKSSKNFNIFRSQKRGLDGLSGAEKIILLSAFSQEKLQV